MTVPARTGSALVRGSGWHRAASGHRGSRRSSRIDPVGVVTRHRRVGAHRHWPYRWRILAVAVVGGGDPPQGVARHNGVGDSVGGVASRGAGRRERASHRTVGVRGAGREPDGGDEGGCRAMEGEAPVSIVLPASEVIGQGGDREREVRPGEPAEGAKRCGQTRPDRLRNTSATWRAVGTWCGSGRRRSQSGRRGCRRVRQRARECAEPFCDLSSVRSACQPGGCESSGGRHGHPSEVVPLTSVADSVTVI